jgi:dipeptide/tripeptide permease
MRVKTRILRAISLGAIFLPAMVQACSVCFSGDDDALTHAFNWSVGFLLAAPYMIAGTIAACLVIAYRRAAAKQPVLTELEVQEAINPLIWTQEESAK